MTKKLSQAILITLCALLYTNAYARFGSVLQIPSATGKINTIRISDAGTTTVTPTTIWFTIDNFAGTTTCSQLYGLNRIGVKYTSQSKEILSALLSIKMTDKAIDVKVDSECKLIWLNLK